MIFADPPYFLSNGGISVQSGKQVSVNKGDWDKSQGFEKDNEFNRQWLSLCREKLTEDGTIWISGTYHNIFSVAQMLNELDKYSIDKNYNFVVATIHPDNIYSINNFIKDSYFIIDIVLKISTIII